MQTFLWLAPTLRRNKFSPPYFKILGEQIWKGETRGCWKTTGSDIVYLKSWKVLPCLKMFSTWPMTNNDLLWYSRNKNVNSKLRCYKRLLQFLLKSIHDWWQNRLGYHKVHLLARLPNRISSIVKICLAYLPIYQVAKLPIIFWQIQFWSRHDSMPLNLMQPITWFVLLDTFCCLKINLYNCK